ncbi:LLM class flavin-dependent oxidoreductase [Streptomyces sp. NBC_01637]|uniref:LLM class flavin-dependent oxidoreductase n=1 Tax=unclassified Streptomyces TaxID=2593676 RepID=UPI0038646972
MKLSLVELAVVAPGSDKPQALKDAVDAARHAENLGHHRVWYAEHHDTAGFAAQAPEILIALAARTTGRIRVGSLALPGQKGAEALPLGARRVTAVVRARWLTMGQPHPPVPPFKLGVRMRGTCGLRSCTATPMPSGPPVRSRGGRVVLWQVTGDLPRGHLTGERCTDTRATTRSGRRLQGADGHCAKGCPRRRPTN